MLRFLECGTSIIKIKGVKELKEVSYNVMPDRIEAGTILIGVAMTGGKVHLKKVIPEHISPILHKLEEIGCEIKTNKNSIVLVSPKKLKSTEFKTMPYPGFAIDFCLYVNNCKRYINCY